MALEICGDQAIFMPEEQCDSCEQFMSDIQRLDRAVENTYTKAEVDALIADVEHVHLAEVDVLPATGEANVIYLVPRSSGTGKEMWIYSNDVWHDLGPATIDLSNYYTKTEVDNLLAAELSEYYTASHTDGLLNGKVDKVSGMGLSQNSYTTAEKNKLYPLPTAASLNTSLSNKQDNLTFDNVPTDGSNNPVKSDGVYDRFNQSDSNIAPIETSPATAAHAVGDWIMVDGSLYRVTAAIAPGDTLTVGGNIKSGTVLSNSGWISLGLFSDNKSSAYGRLCDNFAIIYADIYDSAGAISLTVPAEFAGLATRNQIFGRHDAPSYSCSLIIADITLTAMFNYPPGGSVRGTLVYPLANALH